MSQKEHRSDANSGPIHTPPPEQGLHPFEPDFSRPRNLFDHYLEPVFALIRWPADWFHNNVAERYKGPKYYWYHRRFRRATPIDECYIDDDACAYEANLEFLRNRRVDKATLDILKYRVDSCYTYYYHEKGLNYVVPSAKCKDIKDTYDREEENFFIKYGEMPAKATIINAYTKQKHRMIMERRRAAMQKNKEELNVE